MKRQLI